MCWLLLMELMIDREIETCEWMLAATPRSSGHGARNPALAHCINELIHSGQVESLADVARMCGVSRARVSQIVDPFSSQPVTLPSALATWVDE